jgi:hypothetical protein
VWCFLLKFLSHDRNSPIITSPFVFGSWIGLSLLSCENAREGCHLQHSRLVVAMVGVSVASVVALEVVLWNNSTTYFGSCLKLFYFLFIRCKLANMIYKLQLEGECLKYYVAHET